MSLHEAFNLDRDLCPLSAECGELFSEPGKYGAGRVRAGDDDGLLAQRPGDFVCEAAAHPRHELGQAVPEPEGAGRGPAPMLGGSE